MTTRPRRPTTARGEPSQRPPGRHGARSLVRGAASRPRRAPSSLAASLALFAQTSDGVMAIGPGCRVLTWNSAAEALLGYTAQETRDRRCYEVIRGLDAHGNVFCHSHCPVLVMARRRQLPRAYDVTACTKGGAPRGLNVSTVVLPSRTGPTVVHMFRAVPAPQTVADRQDQRTHALAEIDGAGRAARLTRRERDVLQLMAQGYNTVAIAHRLAVTRTTVRSHIQNVLGKLGAHSRLEAVVRTMRTAWGTTPPEDA